MDLRKGLGALRKVVEKPSRIDLHIHSAASTLTKDAGNKSLEECNAGNIAVLLKSLESYGVNVCAITDHDIFDYELYKTLKSYEGVGSLELVLPGIEFSVELNEATGSNSVIHIVAVFDDADDRKVSHIRDHLVGSDGKPRYNNKNKSAFTEDGLEIILRNIDLDVVLIGHEKSAGRGSKRDISSLDNATVNDVILTEFVDAVEIRNRHKELDIKHLIDTYPRDDVPFILGSDCHDWAVYPLKDASMKGRESELAFSSIKSLPTFRGLVMAITDHSRIKVVVCRKLVSSIPARAAGLEPARAAGRRPEPSAFYTTITQPSQASPRWRPLRRPSPSRPRRRAPGRGRAPTCGRP